MNLLSKLRCEFTHNKSEQNKVGGLLKLVEQIALNKSMKVVEVGSYAGVSSELFAIHCKTIFCIDKWQPYANLSLEVLRKGESQFNEMLQRNVNVVKVKMDSLEAASLFADGVFDLCYIDADHSYDSVTKDIRAWLPKVKTSGWMAGHDFNMPSVYSAVVDSFGNQEIRQFVDTSWLIPVDPSLQPLSKSTKIKLI